MWFFLESIQDAWHTSSELSKPVNMFLHMVIDNMHSNNPVCEYRQSLLCRMCLFRRRAKWSLSYNITVLWEVYKDTTEQLKSNNNIDIRTYLTETWVHTPCTLFLHMYNHCACTCRSSWENHKYTVPRGQCLHSDHQRISVLLQLMLQKMKNIFHRRDLLLCLQMISIRWNFMSTTSCTYMNIHINCNNLEKLFYPKFWKVWWQHYGETSFAFNSHISLLSATFFTDIVH